jgi:cleavage and polyadenylation specificity factor subunit 3
LGEPDEIVAMDGRKLPLRMKVDYISFSAHVDYTQNSEFIDEMKPPHLVTFLPTFLQILHIAFYLH